jgi:SAM-dependent methyltransferase
MRLLLDPWYHDFEVLGLKTGIEHPNQRCKQRYLFPYIDRAISICRRHTDAVSGVELFCADGFYANYAVLHGASGMLGIDANDYYIMKAKTIARALGNADKIRFQRADVFDLARCFDFCICAGGLYHLADPEALLRLMRGKIRYALVIQTVYSLVDAREDYFESPAPGWSWGSRFSYEYLLRMVDRSDWRILEADRNELEGNERPEDRGSAYLLCTPGAASV